MLIKSNIHKLTVESASDVTLTLDNCTITSLSAETEKTITAKGKGYIEDVSGVKNLVIPNENGDDVRLTSAPATSKPLLMVTSRFSGFFSETVQVALVMVPVLLSSYLTVLSFRFTGVFWK